MIVYGNITNITATLHQSGLNGRVVRLFSVKMHENIWNLKKAITVKDYQTVRHKILSF